MDVSENSGTPKSSSLIGLSHHKPSILGETPLFLETPLNSLVRSLPGGGSTPFRCISPFFRSQNFGDLSEDASMAAVVAELAKITEEHPYLPLAGGYTKKTPGFRLFFFGGGGGKMEVDPGIWCVFFFWGGNLWGSGFKLFLFSFFVKPCKLGEDEPNSFRDRNHQGPSSH